MTDKEARKLRPGSRVQWSDGTLGTVMDADDSAAQIRWDDGKAGAYRFTSWPLWDSIAIAERE